MKNLIVISAALMLGACAMKQKVLDVPAVSMTHNSISEGKSLQEIGPVAGRFCAQSGQKGRYGLMDEAIKNAQQTSKADFLLNASFYREGSCMSVEGTGARIK